MRKKTVLTFVIGFTLGFLSYILFCYAQLWYNSHKDYSQYKMEVDDPYYRSDMEIHNDSLVHSKEYQAIIDSVMDEVYLTYAKRRIEEKIYDKEVVSETQSSSNRSEKVNKAKELIEGKKYREAAELFMQLGCCHELWGLQKSILRNKYNMIWYSPSEINPEITYD